MLGNAGRGKQWAAALESDKALLGCIPLKVFSHILELLVGSQRAGRIIRLEALLQGQSLIEINCSVTGAGARRLTIEHKKCFGLWAVCGQVIIITIISSITK